MPSTLSDLTAAILVGGLGTRLRSVLPDHQKVMAPVTGRPFVTFLLDQLADAGLQNVVLCTGHHGEQVRAHFGDQYRTLRLRYSQEPEPLGTAGALRLALPMLESDPVLAMNGDSFCEVDLVALRTAYRPPATIVVREVPDTTQFGRVAISDDGAVTSFIEKGQSAGNGWINAGIYLLSREVLESIPTSPAVSIERETFPAWVGRGLSAFNTHAKFLDIGTPAAYSQAQGFFKP